MAAERETISLIGSDKVQGTAVYGADGEKIGAIERVMIEKVSGRVSYAVLSFGGFLGIGDDHYPLPWPSLKYNVELGGYQTLVPVEKINGDRNTPLLSRGIGKAESALAAWMITMELFRLKHGLPGGLEGTVISLSPPFSCISSIRY